VLLHVVEFKAEHLKVGEVVEEDLQQLADLFGQCWSSDLADLDDRLQGEKLDLVSSMLQTLSSHQGNDDGDGFLLLFDPGVPGGLFRDIAQTHKDRLQALGGSECGLDDGLLDAVEAAKEVVQECFERIVDLFDRVDEALFEKVCEGQTTRFSHTHRRDCHAIDQFLEDLNKVLLHKLSSV
jgi:hypothetical protein